MLFPFNRAEKPVLKSLILSKFWNTDKFKS